MKLEERRVDVGLRAAVPDLKQKDQISLEVDDEDDDSVNIDF